MLAHKKAICPATECSRDTDVVVVLRAHKEEKLTQHQLRWFGHVQRRPPEAPVRSGVLKRVDKVKRVDVDLS